MLVAPQAVALVPGDMQARLREPRVFAALCRCVRQLLKSRALRGAPEVRRPERKAWGDLVWHACKQQSGAVGRRHLFSMAARMLV